MPAPVVTALPTRGRGHCRRSSSTARLADAAGRARPQLGAPGPGCELDRARAHALRRELRRAGAFRLSAASCTHVTSRRHDCEQLERRGVPATKPRSPPSRRSPRAGLVDDRQVARARAAALADRGYSDAAIRWRLETEGFASGQISDAVATLEPERGRAARIVRARGPGQTTARRLARRGFGEDAVDGSRCGRPVNGARIPRYHPTFCLHRDTFESDSTNILPPRFQA